MQILAFVIGRLLLYAISVIIMKKNKMRRAQYRYSHNGGIRAYPTRLWSLTRSNHRYLAILLVIVIAAGLFLSIPFNKQIKRTDYSVLGENYQICTTQAAQYLTSKYTYDALPAGQMTYTVQQYENLPGYNTTLPPLPSYIANESSSTEAAEIFAPGSTAVTSPAYDFPETPIIYYFEGGSYGQLGLQTISGDEFYGGSATGFPEPIFNNGGNAAGIDAGNDSFNFSGEQTALASTASAGATTVTLTNNPSAYANYVTFSDGSTYQIQSNAGPTVTLSSALASQESIGSAAWTSSTLPLGEVSAGAAQSASSVSITNATVPLVQYGQIAIGSDAYEMTSVAGSESGGYTVGVKGLDGTVAADTPIFYVLPAGDVTVEYLNINDDLHDTTGTINMGSGWTVEHNNIHDGYSTPGLGVALYGGDEATVEYNCLARMGDYGGGGSGTNETFEYNELYQDANEADPGCGCSGGGKWWGTLNTNILNNAFVDIGTGDGQSAVWLDNGNSGADIEGNYFYMDAGTAIDNETGYNMKVNDNLFIDDGWQTGTGQGSNDDGAVSLNSSGGTEVPGSRYENSTTVTNNFFVNDWQGVSIWQAGLRSCLSSGEGYPDDAAYCSGGFPNTNTTTAGSQYYFSHQGNDNVGGTTTLEANANSGSTTLLIKGNEAIDDQVDIKNPANTTTADTTNVASFTGSGTINVTSTSGFPTAGQLSVETSSNQPAVLSYTGTTATSFTGVLLIDDPDESGSGTLTGAVAVNNPSYTTSTSTTNVTSFTGTQSLATVSTSGFPASGELRVGTTSGFEDAGGGYSGAILSYTGVSGTSFTGVSLVRGTGDLSGSNGPPSNPVPIQEVQPYKVTGETCYSNDCSLTISPGLSTAVTSGDEVTNAGTCSLYATSVSTPTSPTAPSGAGSYWDGCQWQSKAIAINGNTFVFQPSVISDSAPPIGNATTTQCTAANSCGTNFMMYQVGGAWPPFNDETDGNAMMSNSALSSCPGWDSGCTADPLTNINALASPPDAVTGNGEAPFNDIWSNNTYLGPWTFNAYNFGACYPLPTDSSSGSTKSIPNAACGTTTYADWQSDWQQDAGSTYTLLPSVPTNVQATASSSSSIGVSWTASTDTGGPGLSGYQVYRNGSLVGTSNASTTSYTDTGLTAGTQYSYTVQAYDTSNNQSGASSPPATATTPTGCDVPLYRLRNSQTGDHLYTANLTEVIGALNSGFVPEGIAGYVDQANNGSETALYRLRQIASGFHFYTTSQSEETTLVGSGQYANEGIAGYVSSSSGSNLLTFLRLYDSHNGLHFYTDSQSEASALETASGGYQSEGNAGYIYQSF